MREVDARHAAASDLTLDPISPPKHVRKGRIRHVSEKRGKALTGRPLEKRRVLFALGQQLLQLSKPAFITPTQLHQERGTQLRRRIERRIEQG